MAKKATRAARTRVSRAVRVRLRAEYGLGLPTFARMVGVPEATLRHWEEGNGQLDAAARARMERAGSILSGLAGVMRKSFIPTWLGQPNDGCKALGAPTPLVLLERGQYQDVEAMIFYLGSGVPG